MAEKQVQDRADNAAGAGGGDQQQNDARPSIRESLEKGFADARKADVEDRGDGRGEGGRFAKGGAQKSRARQEEETDQQEEEQAAAGEGEQGEQGEEQVAAGEGEQGEEQPEESQDDEGVQRPKDWPADVAEVWDTLPKEAQAVVAKRLADSQKGVDELKARYKNLDDALAPHLPAIRQNNLKPEQAVEQLFAWFQALAANPAVAFPALAKSFNVDLNKLVGATEKQVEKAAGEAGADKAAADTSGLPPEIKAAIDAAVTPLKEENAELKKQINGFGQSFQSINEQKTNEVISTWANGKPHFAEVRALMGQLIASGAVPLKDGKVDLDGAYSTAIWAHPEVRVKVIAEQEAARVKAAKDAEKRKQQNAQQGADKARNAAVSLTGGAPGAANLADKGKQAKKGRSVRETLMDAIEEVGS